MTGFTADVEKALAVLEFVGRERVLNARANAQRNLSHEVVEVTGTLLGGPFLIRIEFDERPKPCSKCGHIEVIE